MTLRARLLTLGLIVGLAASFACKKKKDNPPVPAGDGAAPTVTNTSAICGQSTGGTVTLSATATDNVGVTKVEFLVDGAVVATDTTDPFTGSWNTAGFASGGRAVTAKAYDASGLTATSAQACTATLAKRMFVKTPFEPNGNLGGLAGADALCQAAATGAGLNGTWKAWMSDSSTDARDRIADVGPWYFPDKTTKVADNEADLIDGTVDTNLLIDQTGASLGGPFPVWTGTLSSGVKTPTPPDPGCSNWTDGITGTAQVGSTQDVGPGWTANAVLGCGNNAHIYCFEQ